MRKTINPKILVHLTIDPELKRFAIEKNINLSELLEESIKELMSVTNEDPKEYEDIAQSITELWDTQRKYLATKYIFEDKALLQENKIKMLRELRSTYGLPLEIAKRVIDKYVQRKRELFK